MLVGTFGVESVFKDVDDIEPGDDFVDKITAAVAACDVLLALIGPQWLTLTDQQGRRRLDNPEDFVRLEVRAALSRGVRVVPILVDGAKMPSADQLPEELAPLTRRQAVEIDPIGFNTDRLLATLAATFAAANAAPAVEPLVADQVAPKVAPEEPPSRATPAVEPLASGQAVPELPPEQPWASTAAAWPSTAPVRPPAVPAHPPAVPDEPVALPDRPPAVADRSPRLTDEQVGARNGAPPPTLLPGAPVKPRGRSASRRQLLLIGAGALLVFLIGALSVLQPWAGRPLNVTGGTPTPTNTLVPSASGSPAAGDSVPLILAHRGGLEVHQFETQQAMEAAAAAGFSVETDVRFTVDGVAVLVHDEKATRGLDCGGRAISVSETTWADLSKYCRSKPTAKDPAQYPVPKLDNTLEAIAAASDQTMVFLEVKTPQTAAQRKAFLDAPGKFGLRDRTVVTSFNRDWLEATAKADPDTKRMLFVSGTPVPAVDLRDLDLWAVGVEQGVATKEYVAELKAVGIRVMIWVLNDPTRWSTFLSYNPDIVMTAYPAKLKTWLANR